MKHAALGSGRRQRTTIGGDVAVCDNDNAPFQVNVNQVFAALAAAAMNCNEKMAKCEKTCKENLGAFFLDRDESLVSPS